MIDFDLLIVGGGASGTLAASQLLVRAPSPVRIALVDKTGQFARGAAYGTRDPSHLLNVRARGMSAWPDDPDHFVRDLRAHGSACDGSEFLPRRYYGAYLSRVFSQSLANPSHGATCTEIGDEVVRIERRTSSWCVELRSGARVAARAVLLACGNERPAPLPIPDGGVFASDAWLASPWDASALDAVSPGDDVLLIGTSLTAVDVVLSLLARGHRGHLTAVSRHGLLPRSHLETSQPLTWTGAPPEPTALGLLRGLRAAARAGRERGEAWQDMVDSLRPHHAGLWAQLPDVERRRFLRHLRARWDVVRHRMAPEIARRITDAIERGQLEILAGRPQRIERHEGGLRCTLRVRGTGAERTVTARWGVNCTGPASPASSPDPLLRSLLESGLAVADPLGLGIVTRDGRVIDREGRAHPDLLAMGSLRKAELWESVAIPELRVQAAQAARALLQELR